MPHTNSFNSEEAPILSDDTHMPYAKRTVSFFFWAGFIILAIVMFLGWQMHENAQDNTQQTATAEQSNDKPLHDFFYSLFNGTEQAGITVEKAVATSATLPPEATLGDVTEEVSKAEALSQKLLKDALVYDYMGTLTATVDAVIYDNEGVDTIYFELSPAIAPNADPRVYSMPYEEAAVFKTEDGLYKIMLDKAQTAAVASMLLQE